MVDQKEIDVCAGKENAQEALECIKEVVRASSQDNCPLKLVLLSQESCEPCDEVKATHQEDIDKGIIQYFNVDKSARGMDIVKKNEIELLPSLVLLDCNDKVIEPSD